jgi:hypothetical protein
MYAPAPPALASIAVQAHPDLHKRQLADNAQKNPMQSLLGELVVRTREGGRRRILAATILGTAFSVNRLSETMAKWIPA